MRDAAGNSNLAAQSGFDSWSAYWMAQGTAWRTEPEIDSERQQYLAERRTVQPDVERGIYPFRDEAGSIHLSRADVEWLLATHENRGALGPVDPDDDEHRQRFGLDLRGATVRGENLSRLPLTRLIGGLMFDDLPESRKHDPFASMRGEAALHAEGANLSQAHLEGAHLPYAYLNHADLSDAHLEGASLIWAHLEHTSLLRVHAEGAHLVQAQLPYAHAMWAHLEGARLTEACLDQAALDAAHLESATLTHASLVGASLSKAYLHGADLTLAHLEGALLQDAQLGGKVMMAADLERVRRWEPRFQLVASAASLREAFFDAATQLRQVHLGDDQLGFVSLVDAHFNGANLGVVDWSRVVMLGDEYVVRQPEKPLKDLQPGIRDYLYQQAMQANRQLAVALRAQGLNEAADYYGYRAQVLHRNVLLAAHKYPRWLFWSLLGGLAGYGYKPGRTLLCYTGVLVLSVIIYCWQGALFAHLHTPWQNILGTAIVDAFTALHGRGFFPTPAESGWQMGTAAFDAVAGLLVEASFIATFTQRFFAH